MKRCPVARVYGDSHSNSQEQMKEAGGREEEEEAAVITGWTHMNSVGRSSVY